MDFGRPVSREITPCHAHNLRKSNRRPVQIHIIPDFSRSIVVEFENSRLRDKAINQIKAFEFQDCNKSTWKPAVDILRSIPRTEETIWSTSMPLHASRESLRHFLWEFFRLEGDVPDSSTIKEESIASPNVSCLIYRHRAPLWLQKMFFGNTYQLQRKLEIRDEGACEFCRVPPQPTTVDIPSRLQYPERLVNVTCTAEARDLAPPNGTSPSQSRHERMVDTLLQAPSMSTSLYKPVPIVSEQRPGLQNEQPVSKERKLLTTRNPNAVTSSKLSLEPRDSGDNLSQVLDTTLPVASSWPIPSPRKGSLNDVNRTTFLVDLGYLVGFEKLHKASGADLILSFNRFVDFYFPGSDKCSKLDALNRVRTQQSQNYKPRYV